MRREPETVLHIAVAHYLDQALPVGFFHTAIPAGGGGYVRGAKWKARGYKAGMPDHAIFAEACCINGEPGLWYEKQAVLWLELKSKTGSLSPEQKAMHTRLRDLGHRVEVVKTLDQVEAVLADFCHPAKLRARVAA